MALLITPICIIITVFSYYRYRYLFNPMTFMFGLWSILIPISALNLFHIHAVTDKAYIIIAVGLFAYSAGIYFGKNNIRLSSSRRIGSFEYYINYKLMYILCAISLVYYIYVLSTVLILLRAGYDLSYIRSLATAEGTNELKSSYLIILVKNFIATPTARFLVAWLPIEWLRGRKDKPLTVMTLVIFLMDVLTTGGRASIILFAEYIIVIYTMRIKTEGHVLFKGKLTGKQKVLISLGVFVLLIFLIQTTYSRKGEDVNFLRQVFIYYIAPIKHFDYYIAFIDDLHSDFYAFGVASFYGFIYPVAYLLKIVGFYDHSVFLETARNYSFEMLEHTVNLGGDIRMNAFVTMFYQPYLDGRWLGVVLICFLFGAFCSVAYYRASKTADIRWLLIYLFMFQKIINSEVRFYFTMPAHAICLVLAFIIIRKDKKHYSRE